MYWGQQLNLGRRPSNFFNAQSSTYATLQHEAFQGRLLYISGVVRGVAKS